ncbi:MAG: hypothetical protein PVI92_12725 [Chromatiales bacterium]
MAHSRIETVSDTGNIVGYIQKIVWLQDVQFRFEPLDQRHSTKRVDAKGFDRILGSNRCRDQMFRQLLFPGQSPDNPNSMFQTIGRITAISLPIKAENWWQNTFEIPVYPTSIYLTPRISG